MSELKPRDNRELAAKDTKLLEFDPDSLYLATRVPWFRPHPYLCWAAVSSVASLSSVLLYYITGTISFISTFLPLSVAIGVVPICIRLGAVQIKNWLPSLDLFTIESRPGQLYSLVTEEAAAAYEPKSVEPLGAAAVILAFLAFVWGGAFHDWSWGSRLIASAILVCSAFHAWTGVYYVFFFSRFVWRLGRLSVRVTSDKFGVLSTGYILLRCYSLGTVVWLVYTVSGAWQLMWVPLALLALPGMLFFVGSFVACQIPLHIRMREYKLGEIRRIQKWLDELQPKGIEDLSEQKQARLGLCKQHLTEIVELPEWPFTFGAFGGVCLSSITAVLPLILKSLPWKDLLTRIVISLQ